MLMKQHEDDDSLIYTLSSWLSNEQLGLPANASALERFPLLIRRWVGPDEPDMVTGPLRYILFDEAQDSYWDGALWNDFIKLVAGRKTRFRVALFCFRSFGNLSQQFEPNGRPNPTSTPLTLSPEASISLKPSLDQDVGLLLTEKEYVDLLARHPTWVIIGDDMKSAIYSWTAGHVGAVESAIAFIAQEVRDSRWLISRLNQ